MEEGEHDPFGPFGERVDWREKTLFVALRDGQGRLVARAGLLIDDISVAERPLRVVGLGDVLVAPSLRGRGLALKVVKAAVDRAISLGPELIMLFCAPPNRGLYARLGFQDIRAPVTVGQPAGPVVMAAAAMWAPLRAGARWPPGDVILHDLPF